MARWIDATASQRFWQYIYPTAKRLIESGEWDQCIANYDVKISGMEERLAAAVPGSLEHRQWTRRVEAERGYRASVVRSKEQDLATIAEAERRRAAQKARRTAA